MLLEQKARITEHKINLHSQSNHHADAQKKFEPHMSASIPTSLMISKKEIKSAASLP